MISVKKYTHWLILGTKHPRIWVPPTQLQNFTKNFKIKFPGNSTKILIYPESVWFTESVAVFWKVKIANIKKLCLFLFPEFSLYMNTRLNRFRSIQGSFQKCTYVHSLWARIKSSNDPKYEKLRNFQRKILKRDPIFLLCNHFVGFFKNFFIKNDEKKFDVKTHEQFIRSKPHLHLVRNWDYPQIERISTSPCPAQRLFEKCTYAGV